VKPIIKSSRGLFGTITIVVMILMATIGPEVVPLDLEPHPENMWCTPSLQHLFGCDYLGRDLFAMIIHGSREVFLIPFLASLIGVLIGVVLGLLGGFIGGLSRRIITALTDIWLTIPSFPAIFIMAYAFPKSYLTMVIILAVFSWPGLTRSIISEVSSLKTRDYVEAAVNLSLGRSHILFREILPHLMPYIAYNLGALYVGNMTSLIGIIFLGVAPLNVTNWGYILNTMIYTYRALLIPQATPAILIILLLLIYVKLGVVYFAQSLEEVFNPRLRAYE
jgi:peptide/nickel transport system permease protein